MEIWILGVVRMRLWNGVLLWSISVAGEAEGSVESCKHGCWGSRTPRGKCDVLGLREGVRDLYVVFALPNPVVRDAPYLWAQLHLCTSQLLGLQAWIIDLDVSGVSCERKLALSKMTNSSRSVPLDPYGASPHHENPGSVSRTLLTQT
jgi:hypothetical protein